ncbi:hypothetical protein SDC9_99834 [bioreactor metagenome]|uniref:Uncharacterized protein n=1 Tax=bioreactor metagenome TaxID=1076179 RepID=A0A645AIW8_9ZZZZ
MFVYSPDKSKWITSRLQKYCITSCLHQSRCVYRLMIVSVKKHKVSRGNQCINGDCIGGTCPVHYKISFICIIYSCSINLSICRRTFMNQQISKCNIRIANVSKEYIFTIEIKQVSACRMFLEILSSLMTRTIKLNIVHLHIIGQ